jgi:lipoprotein NlpD
MTLKKSTLYWGCIVMAFAMLAGCRASGNHRAPVEDRVAPGSYRAPVEDRGDAARKSSTATAVSKPAVQREAEKQSKTYVVQKGDTLYSIAFEHGLDYREVADLNNIKNPGAIQIGQQIQLAEAEPAAVEKAVVHAVPVSAIKTQPRVGKLPYSEQAVAQIESMQQEPGPAIAVAPVAAKPAIDSAQEKESAADDAVQWGMPTKGKVLSGYSESANRKGVDIAGSKGQAVLASAAGKVVYSGSGLRGYGKLVIIKHNKTYLSAYAHNDKILVKEGQNISKGQKIAEMGNTDADQVKLHFEIRKFGKPVDPAKYLNLPQS